MATQYGIPYTFVCNGETAEVGPQDLPDANYVGIPTEISGLDSPEVRESGQNIPEADGGINNPFYLGRRPFTFEVMVDPGVTSENVQIDKLNKATNALRTDGTLTWTETGRVQTRLLYRRTGFRISDKRPKRILLALVAANPRIEAVTPQTGSSPKTNSGNIGAPPTFTLTPTGGNVVITNTTAGLGSPALTLTVGAGYVTTGSAVTVDFGAKTITQGGVLKPQAEVFPTSTWWEVVPGANTWTVTNASSVSISFRDSWL